MSQQLAHIHWLDGAPGAPAPARPIRSIGLPRGLLFYRFGVLWQVFFEELGFDVRLSQPTDHATLLAGRELSVDECCLPSKVYLGHVKELVGQVDALFIPSFGSAHKREGFCTKFQSLPDLAANTLRGQPTALISVFVDNATKIKEMEHAYKALGVLLGARPDKAVRAFRAALAAQTEADDAAATNLAQKFEARLQARANDHISSRANGETSDAAQNGDETLTILLASHPYIAHDDYLTGPIVKALTDLGAEVWFADQIERTEALKASYGFSATLPWTINRELVGAMLQLSPAIDGIVLVSAFSCGPDSMTDDVILRYFEGRPILNLIIDETSGIAGLQTRIESFIDILRFARKGGYHRD